MLASPLDWSSRVGTCCNCVFVNIDGGVIIVTKCYTGTPGSGKSLHATRNISGWLEEGKNVIANFPIKVQNIKKNKGHFYYIPNDDITVPLLLQFSQTMHKPRQMGQTLIVIDEASVKFNSRTWNASDRLDFLSFFAQHRHYGFDIILIQQNLNQIDSQIRALVEIEIHHRHANNYWVYRWLPFQLFIAVEKNLAIKDKNSADFFTYSKKYGELYDTFFEFNPSLVNKPTETIQNQIITSEIIVIDGKAGRKVLKSQKAPPTPSGGRTPAGAGPARRTPEGGLT